MATAGYFFVDFDMEKTCSAQNRFDAKYLCLCTVESSRNPVSEVKKVKNGVREKYLTRRKFKAIPAVYQQIRGKSLWRSYLIT